MADLPSSYYHRPIWWCADHLRWGWPSRDHDICKKTDWVLVFSSCLSTELCPALAGSGSRNCEPSWTTHSWAQPGTTSWVSLGGFTELGLGWVWDCCQLTLMDRRRAVGYSWAAHRPHCRPAVWRIRAADRCVDCADNNDIWLVSLSPSSANGIVRNKALSCTVYNFKMLPGGCGQKVC